MFENRILRRIFGPKWDENGEFMLFTQYSQVITSGKLRCAGHVARFEEDKRALNISTVSRTDLDSQGEYASCGSPISIRFYFVV